jgi:hypothetical protein
MKESGNHGEQDQRRSRGGVFVKDSTFPNQATRNVAFNEVLLCPLPAYLIIFLFTVTSAYNYLT